MKERHHAELADPLDEAMQPGAVVRDALEAAVEADPDHAELLTPVDLGQAGPTVERLDNSHAGGKPRRRPPEIGHHAVVDPSRVGQPFGTQIRVAPDDHRLADASLVEHGRSPHDKVRRWQDRLNGFQQRIAGGCNLNRDIPALIEAGGFRILRLDTYYARREPKPIGYLYEGVAT